ncbi:MAG: hypothetical protein ACRDDZ_11645 [Marinifilaceae bacterium]
MRRTYLLTGCNNAENSDAERLTVALSLSGNNKVELGQVLNHDKTIQPNVLKL